MVASDPTSASIADAEPDPPAGHRIALRHGEELDRHLARARNLEDAGRWAAVEHQVGVGQVGDHPDVLALRQRHDLLVKARSAVAEVGLWGKLTINPFGRRGERASAASISLSGPCRGHGDRHRLATRDDHAEAVNRVARVGGQHAVPRTDQRQQQMRQPFLGADGDDRLALRVEASVRSDAGTSRRWRHAPRAGPWTACSAGCPGAAPQS